MARVDYTTDSETDSRLNPAEQAKFDQISAGYDSGSELSDREKDAINDLESQFDNKDSDLNPNQNDSASAAVNNQESSVPSNGFYQPSAGKKKSPVTFKSLLKKRGPIAAIAGTLGLGGGIMGIFLSPATMLQNIMENFTQKNDSASIVKEVRMKKVMNKMIDADDDTGICKNKKIRCKTGRLSNRALKKFKKSGLIPVDADGKEMDIKGRGYPEKNPTHWKIEGVNDGKPIEASKLKDELLKKENRKIASKVYGRTGLFNMRFRSWTGKHISRLYSKFQLKRNSAISKIDKKLGIKEKREKLKEKLPKFKEGPAFENVKKGVNKLGGKLKKGGLAYTISAGACAAVKIPSLIGAGAAALELAPVLGLVMDVILSPGSQAKASGLGSQPVAALLFGQKALAAESTGGSGFSQETMETIGTMLTERGKMEGSENTEGSALDSPYLLAAMGVNSNKPGIAKNYIPGYSVVTNPIVQGFNKAKEATEGVCDYILSPVAMYAFIAAEAAAAASTGGVSAIISFAGKMTLSEVIKKVLEYAVGEQVKKILTELAKSLLTPDKAQYKDLGDALGVGAAAFFSAGSMGQMLPGLKMSQLAEFNGIQIANEEFQKEMDIASLSPFDTSSKYTFLGSIFHNMGNMMMVNGTYSKTPVAMLSNILRLPSMALSYSSTAKAASGMYSDKYCGYAKDFSMGSGSSEDPAINLAAMPCSGITKSQANMSVEEAIQIAEDEGWIKKDADIPDGATISDLMDKYIIKDTPLYDFIEDCSDASSGNYWFNSGGCTAPTDSTQTTSSTAPTYKDDKGKDITDQSFGAENSAKQYDDKKLSAMSVLLIDFQIAQSINGEDDEEDTPSTTTKVSNSGEAVGEPELEEAQSGWGNHSNGEIPDSELQALSFSPENKMHKKAATAMEEMNKAYKADNGSDLTINEAYRDCATQAAYATPGNPLYQGGNAADYPPCQSNHGWGLAVDINVGGFDSSVYKWLKANAHKYGYVHPAWAEPGTKKSEAWHWEYARRV